MAESTYEHSPYRIDRFRVIRAIARGGTGQVYEVEDPVTGRHLALKLLLERGSAIPRFCREYEAMIRLNHPNVARVYQFGLYEGQPWQTMELVHGAPIQRHMIRKGRPESKKRLREVLRLGHDLAHALHHVHRRGLVHRDLKSANCLVLPDGRIKLIDFGSTRLLGDAPITQEGDFVGTFAYASPEQLVAGRIDGRADLYSLGVLLYRLSTGKRPFEHDNPTSLARMHLQDQPQPPKELNAAMPDGLQDLIMDLLQKRPGDRPKTGRVVAKRLERIAGEPLATVRQIAVEASANRLVGREDEHTKLRTFLDSKEPGSCLLIEAMAGSGRYSFIKTASTEADHRRRQSFQSMLFPENDLISLHVMLQQLYEAVPPTSEESQQKLLSALETVTEEVGISASQSQAIRRQLTFDLLRQVSLADDHGIVLFLEDLQYASMTTIDWLQCLLQDVARDGLPVQVIASIDPRRKPISNQLKQRLPYAEWIHLGPLEIDQVGLLMGSLVNRRPPEPGLARKIFQVSGGLPEYVEDILQDMIRADAIAEHPDDPDRVIWHSESDWSPELPPGALEDLRSEYLALPAIFRRMLHVVCLLPPNSDIEEISRSAGWDIDATTYLISNLRDLGWLSSGSTSPRARVKWRNPIFEQIIQNEITQVRRHAAQLSLSRRVDHPSADTKTVQRLLDIGQIEDAATLSIKLTNTLTSQGLGTESEAIAQQVIQAADDLDLPLEGKRGALELVRASALVRTNPMHPAIHQGLERAAADVAAERVSFVRGLHAERIGHITNSEEHLAAALEAARESGASAITVAASFRLGLNALAKGDLPLVEQICEGIRTERATTDEGPTLHRYADLLQAELMLQSLQFERAAALSWQMIEHFEEQRDHDALALAHVTWANSLRMQGQFSIPLMQLPEAVRRMRYLDDPVPHLMVLEAMGWLEAEIGRLGRAQEIVDEIRTNIRPGQHLLPRLRCQLLHGRVLVASGQLSIAGQVLNEACNVAAKAGLRPITELSRALLAEALWQNGQVDDADRLFRGAFKRIATGEYHWTRLEIWRARIRASSAGFDPDKSIEELFGTLPPERMGIAAIDLAIAQAKHAEHASNQPAPSAWSDATAVLRELDEHLSASDRNAIRVHPWAKQISIHTGQSLYPPHASA